MTVWDALIGQPGAVEALSRAATEGRLIVQADRGDDSARNEDRESLKGALSHAWLITGPPGSGRSTAATALAAALQCTGEPVGCGVCPGCHTTLQKTNADVQQYATDKRIITRKDARAWVRRSYEAPPGGKWRVTIIEDADRIQDQSAGVLLKAVEEPPERGVWVLCAPTLDEVIPTIRSRCRHLNLRTPSVEDVAEYLSKSEGVGLDVAEQAAILAQAHVGVARALIRNPELRRERVDLMTTLLKPRSVGEAVVAAGRLHDAGKAQATADTESKNQRERAALLENLGAEEGKRVPPALRPQIRALEEDQKRRAARALHDTLDRVLTDMLGFFRDVLTVQLGSEAQFVNVDLDEQIRAKAAALTPRAVLTCTSAIEKARADLQTNAAPLLVLESLAITLADPDDQLGPHV